MSHVVAIETKLTDLAAIRDACLAMGWEFLEDQKTFKWFGSWVDDYHASDAAYQLGIDPKDYGKCDHAIRVPGAQYTIGLLKREDGYTPVWDFYGSGGLQGIRAENGMGGFMQRYAAEKAKRELRHKGYSPVERRLDNGKIEIKVRT